jgi:hypothetical protein
MEFDVIGLGGPDHRDFLKLPGNSDVQGSLGNIVEAEFPSTLLVPGASSLQSLSFSSQTCPLLLTWQPLGLPDAFPPLWFIFWTGTLYLNG